MPRAGLLIRQQKALEHAGNKPCPSCQHPMREHRELPRESYDLVEEGGFTSVAVVANPDYKPLHFHCHHEGCDCVHVPKEA